ncbi:MAG TPA: YceI family protein [Puia sp.]|nr:YceI family protein [Puia sp.]
MKLILFIAAFTIVSGLSMTENWSTVAAKAKITFKIKGPFGMVNGNFSGLKSTIKFNEKDLGTSSISASIDAKTVSTGIGLRNRDLRKKEEWLNTDKYPLISFKSTKIEKDAKGYKVIGELTLKGITKPVSIPFTFSPSKNTGIFKGQFVIKRKEFHIGKDGGSVGSDVTINIEVPVKK